MKIKIITSLAISFLLASCYYDKELSTCNTTNITYANTVQALVTSRCNSCHSGTTLNAGLDLSNVTVLRRIALNDSLHKAVTGNGVTRMPFGGPYLSDCEISKLKAWKDAGAP